MTATRKLRRCNRTPAAARVTRHMHRLMRDVAASPRTAETLLRIAPARYQAVVALLVFAYRLTHD